MANARRSVRRVGYVALLVVIAVVMPAIRSAISSPYQELAIDVAFVILAGMIVVGLVTQAKPMARTLRGWRDQL